MGIPLFKTCSSAPSNPVAVAPNPSPTRWTLLDLVQFERAHVMKVHYHDCTNFEGVKVMVYEGEYKSRPFRDPHFDDSSSSPIARFKPDDKGWARALTFAQLL